MRIRADLARPAAVRSDAFEWVASPLPGVERVLLDRIGDEVAVATSIVRYAPGSAFDAHVHGGGEEFLVLDGTFSDEHGDYPTGTYVRNPPGTSHRPFSRDGCVLFVKLRQFDAADDRQLCVTLSDPPQHLFARGAEVVETRDIAGDAELPAAPEVQELLVLDGTLTYRGESYERWSWLRFPPDTAVALAAHPRCVVYHKTRPVYGVMGSE